MLTKKRRSDPDSALYKALLELKNTEEVYHFFLDLCTVPEMLAMEQRFEVARLLSGGMIYAAIEEQTGASSATVSRVNRSLNYGTGGYAMVLSRMEEDKNEPV